MGFGGGGVWGLGEEGCGFGGGGASGGGMRQVGNVGGREYGSWGVGEVEQVGSGGGGEVKGTANWAVHN